MGSKQLRSSRKSLKLSRTSRHTPPQTCVCSRDCLETSSDKSSFMEDSFSNLSHLQTIPWALWLKLSWAATYARVCFGHAAVFCFCKSPITDASVRNPNKPTGSPCWVLLPPSPWLIIGACPALCSSAVMKHDLNQLRRTGFISAYNV